MNGLINPLGEYGLKRGSNKVFMTCKLRPYRYGFIQVGGRRDAVFLLLGNLTRKHNLYCYNSILQGNSSFCEKTGYK